MVISDILMGFVDLIPVVAFLIAAIMLQRDLYNKMSKGAFALFAAGTIIVFVAGLIKAIYKILLTFRICAFQPLSQAFFPMQTVGFVLAGAGIAATMLYKQGEGRTMCFAIPTVAILAMSGDYKELTDNPYSGTMIFVILMCLGVLVMDGGLIIISAKLKSVPAIILLVIAFICTLGMGYLSSKDSMNDWIKEFVNSVGQGSLLGAAIVMRKKGLTNADAPVSLVK